MKVDEFSKKYAHNNQKHFTKSSYFEEFTLSYTLSKTKQSPGGSVKKVLLKISQNSQENICARVAFLINFGQLSRKKSYPMSPAFVRSHPF